MKKVESMAEKSGNSKHLDISGALLDASEMIGKKGAFENGKKVLILALDDIDGNYSVSFVQAGMKMSECISLCEVAKTIFLEQMNYI